MITMKTLLYIFFTLLAEVTFNVIILEKRVTMKSVLLGCHLLVHTDKTPDYTQYPCREKTKQNKQKTKLY